MASRQRKETNKKSLKQVAFTRFLLIVAVFVLWIGGISARLVHLQVNQHEWLLARAEGMRTVVKRTRMPRGTIYDRNGRVLAMSVNVKTLYANPMEIADLPSAARTIAKVITGSNPIQLLKQLKEAKSAERKFLPLAKNLDEIAVQRINLALESPDVKKADSPRFAGLYWREGQMRSYPHETLAAHVIGFSNADGVGQAGIEQSQNTNLYGEVIKKTSERDRLGRIYDETVSEKEAPKDIVLTIDSDIQFQAQEALEKAVRESGAKSGMVIVTDHRTGEILALANYPTFNPNNLSEINKDNLTNRVIQSVYSPGSVFKLVTYGSALENKLITPDGMIDAGNGTIEVAKHTFRDSHSIGSVTYAKALAQSSNVCAIKTGLRVGKENFYSALQRLGFGQRSGIELPAETGGIVRNPAKWNGDSLASMSIGYEIGVSALQMVTAFATIANDGVRIQPHIIKEIRQSDEIIDRGAEPAKTQAFSAETARDLRKMLREVVLTGTARRAQLDGYTSAGKTGTAWKFDEETKKISSSKYISSFIGFVPAENPVVTIGVVMDEPKVGGRDGGQVAAPVFHDIAEQILPELGVARQGGTNQQLTASNEVVPEAAPMEPGTADMPAAEPDERHAAKAASQPAAASKKAHAAAKPSLPARPPADDKARSASRPKAVEPSKLKAPIKNKSST